MTVRLRTKWLWVRISLLPLKIISSYYFKEECLINTEKVSSEMNLVTMAANNSSKLSGYSNTKEKLFTKKESVEWLFIKKYCHLEVDRAKVIILSTFLFTYIQALNKRLMITTPLDGAVIINFIFWFKACIYVNRKVLKMIFRIIFPLIFN